MAVKKVGILFHPLVEATQTKAREVEGFLDSMGISVWLCSAWDREKVSPQLNGTDVILTVGGDGTILRAAQAVIPGSGPCFRQSLPPPARSPVHFMP
jgi:NAD+ kinase